MSRPRTKAGERLAKNLQSLNLSPDPEAWWPEQAITDIEAEASKIDIDALARSLALNEFDDPKAALRSDGEPYPSDIEWAKEVAALYKKQLENAKGN